MTIVQHHVEQFVACLLEGDAENSYSLLVQLRSDGEPVESLYEELVTKAMQRVGELWEQGEITVADEHLATATCDFVLSRFHALHRKQAASDKKMMFFCVEREQHMLGMRMAAFLCEERGWNVRIMGANLPLEHALKAARAWEPDVVCLSVTIIHHVTKLKQYVEAIEALPFQPTVVIGSRLLSTQDLSAYCTDKTVLISRYKELTDWIDNQEKGERNDRSSSTADSRV